MNNVEKELSFREGFLYVCAHVKCLIAGFIIGAILLGGFSYYKSYKESKNTISDNLTEEGLDNKIADLPEEYRDYITRAIFQYREYRIVTEQYKDNYIANLDTNKISTVELQFYVDADYQINYAGNTDIDPSPSIVEAYRIYADGGEVRDAVVAKLEGKIPADALNYLIAASGNSATVNDSNVFTVVCKAADEETGRIIADTVKEMLDKYSAVIGEKIAAHKLTLVNELYAVGMDSVLTNTKTTIKALVDNAYSAKVNFETNIKKLGTQYVNAYNYAKNLYDNIEVEAAKATINKKYLVVGAMGGVVAVAALLFLAFAMSKTVNNADEISELSDSFCFGIIPVTESGIKRKRLRINKEATAENEAEYIGEAVKSFCDKENINELYLTGSYFDGKTEEAVLKLVSDKLNRAGVKISSGMSAVNNADALKKLVTAGAVLIIEAVDKTDRFTLAKQSGICKKNNVKLIGNITVL